tara:strand:+ start:765 stop:1160 length:396 start_codon:yes stop_codon:yes gene_type:complete
MKQFSIFILVIISIGCEKYECVKKSYPELIGDWTHLSANDGFHYIYIQSNGKGSMYGINDHDNNQDTQGRKWYVKEDVLYFSRWQNNVGEDMFIIDKYPSVADNTIHLSYDSIPAGTSYLILNNRTYRKTN